MNRCLCCGKPLKSGGVSGWHKECVEKFFSSENVPEIDLGEETLEKYTLEAVSKGVTVAGVQKKLSLGLSGSGKASRLTLVGYPTGYILKPQSKEFERLPEAEWLAMLMAKESGISTVPFALLDHKGEYAYITKRIDRIGGSREPLRLAMEDFCQLDLRSSADKYKGSCERCMKIIDRYSSSPHLDKTELFLRLVFCFAIGNSDMHLKNFSLIETKDRSGKFALSPAYDLLPVNVLMPEDREQFALPMHGKKSNLRRNDFLVFGESCSLPKSSCEKMIKKILSMKETYFSLIKDSPLSKEMKNSFAELIEKRCLALSEGLLK